MSSKYTRLQDLDNEIDMDQDINYQLPPVFAIFLFLIAFLPMIAFLADLIPLSQPSLQRKTGKWEEFYFSREELQYLNCSELIQGSPEAIDLYVNMGRLKLYPEKLFDLPMNCKSIGRRIGKGPSIQLKRPIAFIRNIYGLYELQEAFLSISYHPDNIFCYAIDSKSSQKLKSSMRKLSKCYEKVIVLEKVYDFDKAGHFQDRAHFDCLEEVLKRGWHWGHAILLQSDDMVIKTPRQLSELSEVLNYTSSMGWEYGSKERYTGIRGWTPRGLKLFKNESNVPASILDQPLIIREYLNQVILSKVFVKSMFENLNLHHIIQLFDDKHLFSVDEMLVNTLYGNYLGLEGQMESTCVTKHDDVLSRLTHWVYTKPGGFDINCKSKWKRHWICVMGVEYLEQLAKSPYVIANKVRASFDFGTVVCMREMVLNEQTGANPDEKYLMKMPQFREMLMKANGSFDKGSFKC